jgi:hypothetical protein
MDLLSNAIDLLSNTIDLLSQPTAPSQPSPGNSQPSQPSPGHPSLPVVGQSAK